MIIKGKGECLLVGRRKDFGGCSVDSSGLSRRKKGFTGPYEKGGQGEERRNGVLGWLQLIKEGSFWEK